VSELQKHDNEFAEYSGFWSNKCVSGGWDWQELERALSLKSFNWLAYADYMRDVHQYQNFENFCCRMT
jgi:hypothetical protein